MSFAGEVKAELCRGKLGRKCCAQAEAYGVLLYCNRFSLSEVKIVTESPAFAQRLPGLFRKAFGVEFDEKGDPDTPGKRIFTISAPEKLALLWELCAFDPSGPAHHINSPTVSPPDRAGRSGTPDGPAPPPAAPEGAARGRESSAYRGHRASRSQDRPGR